MKSIKRILAIAAVALAVAVPQAQAQFHYGLKAGMTVTSLKFDQDMFASSNRTGWTAGAIVEFTVPIIGIGVDASVLYANRAFEVNNLDTALGTGTPATISEHRSYIDIPVNLKWKIGIPAISHIIQPFITTGPDFSFLLSKSNFENAIKNHTFDVAWNVGLGVQLINHLQVAASYGFGISNAASGDEAATTTWKDFSGKNRVWTVTLAYIF